MPKTNPTALMPCPFCGHDLDAQWDRPNPKARCLTEGCKGRQLPVLNLDQSDDIAAWNHRAAGDYAALKNSMTAILEHLGLDPEHLPEGSYSEIVIGAMQAQTAAIGRPIAYVSPDVLKEFQKKARQEDLSLFIMQVPLASRALDDRKCIPIFPGALTSVVPSDDAIEALAKKHIAPKADRMREIARNWPAYQATDQFRRVKALITEVLSLYGSRQDPYRENQAYQADIINMDRLRQWMIAYGISTPESMELFAATFGEQVNAMTLREPFPTRQRAGFDFAAHLERQRDFSLRTFGPGIRTKGVCDHIRKELREVEAKPDDLSEWMDVVILGLDGALRIGANPAAIINALVAKQAKNESRTWPDWRTMDPEKAIEHDRTADSRPAGGPALTE